MRPSCLRLVLAAAILGMLVRAAPVSAEGIITPWIGNASISSIGEADRQTKLTYGFAVGGFGKIAGFELDVGITPDFFGDTDAIGSNSVTTVMGNLVLGPDLGRARPYFAVGAGLLRSRVEGLGDLLDLGSNDVGVNVGGGIMAFFTNAIGVRGDIRYFRNTSDAAQSTLTDIIDLELGSFRFWRISGGLAVRF